MTPTWYDLLGVEPDASSDEIRAAWRAAIADLDPGDRRFRSLNEAAEVLLDPERRAAYDESIDDTQAEPPLTRQKLRGGAKRGSEVSDGSTETPAQRQARQPAEEDEDSRTTAGRIVPAWLLAVAAVLAALAVASVGYLLAQPSDEEIADATSQAQGAAEQAMTVILAYDFRELDANQQAAGELMTPEYRKEYDKLFDEGIQPNAESTKTVVTATVAASGIVRAEADKVEVLVLVDRQTTNAAGEQPLSTDQVRVTMERDGDDWLVDGMETQPLPE